MESKRERERERGIMAKSLGLSSSHVLLLPFPAQGNMLPMLDLAHHLSGHGLAVTVVVTPKNLHFLEPLLAASPSVEPLVLPFPANPSIPSGVESANDLPPSHFLPMAHALSALHLPLLRWARSSLNPPSAILSDFLLCWTHHLSDDLSVPHLVFCPFSILTVSVAHSLWKLMPGGTGVDPDDPDSPVSFPHIPNSPTYSWFQLSPMYWSRRDGDPVHEFIRDGLLANARSWAFVFNSFTGLEGAYLEHVRGDLGHPHVWAVGPIAPLDRGCCRSGAGSADVLRWLDGCREEGTVVYVCFGPQAVLNQPQTEAVAAGLERSGARFVWCARGPGAAPETEPAPFPEGFVERTAGRGLVVDGWVPQVAVLGHRAVGAFLTHCGWNSVLEGITAGTVLLTWPMGADQYVNARLVVEEAEVGARVCEGADAVPDPDELARVVAESVGGSRAERVRELRRKALEAVGEGGSSAQDLEGLVVELSKLKPTK